MLVGWSVGWMDGPWLGPESKLLYHAEDKVNFRCRFALENTRTRKHSRSARVFRRQTNRSKDRQTDEQVEEPP